MSATVFLRWQSSAEPSATGLEWLGSVLSPADLTGALASCVIGHAALPAFVLVRADASALHAFASRSRSSSVGAEPLRLCLAIDRQTLAELDPAPFDPAQVGFLLDDVDAATPLAEMVNPAIEAIRFRADFVHRAARDLRLACALEAMLELARNCGLATLGPASAPNDEWLMPGVAFDYVPSYIVEPQRTGRAETARDGAWERREFQLTS